MYTFTWFAEVSLCSLSAKIIETFSTILCLWNKLYERFKSLHKILAITKVFSS